MRKLVGFRVIPLLLAAAVLVGCDDAQERAEGHHQRGLSLLEQGETEKAILEFRNALQLDQNAKAPRVEFARILLARGELQRALGNYLKVVELDPEHLEARREVARILIFGNAAEEAVPHVEAGLSLAPQDIEMRALKALLDHRQDQPEAAAGMAQAVLADDPGNMIATLVLAEQAQTAGDLRGAVALLDTALAASPDTRDLHVVKLQVLEQLNDQAAIGAQINRMVSLFPEDMQVAQAQVQWYFNQGDLDGAIAAQRGLLERFPDTPAHGINLVGQVAAYQGPDAARKELEQLVAGSANVAVYTQALADFERQQGNPDAAIRILEQLLQTEITAEQSLDTRAQLAELYHHAGNRERAAEIVREILRENEDHLGGLRLRAVQAIDEDRFQDAINDLRAALNITPQNPDILMLLALAHERNGAIGLAGERLALAVQSSGNGINEVLAYADFLARQDQADIAIGVVESAIVAKGEQLSLLSALGQLYLAMSDLKGVANVIERMEGLEQTPDTKVAMQELNLALLAGEDRFADSIGVMEEIWQATGEKSSAMERLVSTYVQAGQTDNAIAFLSDILAGEPDNLRANLLRGAVHVFMGELEAAEARYRKVIEDHPDRANGYGALSELLRQQGRVEEADEIMAVGIAAAEDVGRLLFTQAVRKEQEQDFEAAIKIYEQLYALDKGSDVLANNLASLLAEHRDDAESLDRAHTIARRLRASRNPAFLDTYGWTLFRRGDYERALVPLQEAADLLSNPIIEFHLGMVFDKLGQTDRAIESLERALDLGSGSDLPQLTTAAEVLARLKAEQ